MRNMRKFGTAAVCGILFLSACGQNKMPVSSVNIESEIAENFSVTEDNKYLLEDSVQDVYAEEEKDGATLRVLQTVAYENMICILAEADMDEEIGKVADGYTINAKFEFSVEDRASLHRSGSSELRYDEEKIP